MSNTTDGEARYPEFPYVILDADGVVDRVATVAEAEEYIASMPGGSLRYEFEGVVAS